MISAWYMMKDEIGNGDPARHYLGLRSLGESKKGLNHWLDIVHYRTKDGGDKVRGYAADALLYYRFDASLNPHLTLGYAIGTGDSDQNDSTDHTFR